MKHYLRVFFFIFAVHITFVLCTAELATGTEKFKDYWIHMSADEKMAFVQGYHRGSSSVCLHYVMMLRNELKNAEQSVEMCERLFTLMSFEKVKAAIRILDYVYIKKNYTQIDLETIMSFVTTKDESKARQEIDALVLRLKDKK